MSTHSVGSRLAGASEFPGLGLGLGVSPSPKRRLRAAPAGSSPSRSLSELGSCTSKSLRSSSGKMRSGASSMSCGSERMITRFVASRLAPSGSGAAPPGGGLLGTCSSRVSISTSSLGIVKPTSGRACAVATGCASTAMSVKSSSQRSSTPSHSRPRCTRFTGPARSSRCSASPCRTLTTTSPQAFELSSSAASGLGAGTGAGCAPP
mmetsp:Transcript_30357/g.96882  ORF Transcript_30357/g.96882 Transcript_30357/m.96882 type:complete len:207 (-) Transcript_30357:22-642(-)